MRIRALSEMGLKSMKVGFAPVFAFVLWVLRKSLFLKVGNGSDFPDPSSAMVSELYGCIFPSPEQRAASLEICCCVVGCCTLGLFQKTGQF